MLNNSKNQVAPTVPASNNNNSGSGAIHNSIAQGTTLVGSIDAENDFRVDGVIDGKITSKSRIVIGMTGFIKGEMHCATAEIIGKFEGDMFVTDTVTLRSTANVKGNIKITQPKLYIEPEATFNGQCIMPEVDARPSVSSAEKPEAPLNDKQQPNRGR